MVGRHVQNIQNRSLTRAPQSCSNRTDLPSSPCAKVSCCLPARISRVPHLRIQPRSLEINLAAVQTWLESKFHRLVYCCHFHWFLSLWNSTYPSALAVALRFGRLLVATVSSFVSVLSAVSTLTLEARVLCCRFTVTFAWVALFSFLATLLALAGFSFASPFPGDGIDFHRIFIVCVSGWGRPQDASAPQEILSRHV